MGVVILCAFVVLCVHCCFFTLDAGLLARSQYSEGPATGHLDTGFSRFPCVYKQMLRCFPIFQVATTCFSCSPTDLNLLVTNFVFRLHVQKPLPPGDNPVVVNKLLLLLLLCTGMIFTVISHYYLNRISQAKCIMWK